MPLKAIEVNPRAGILPNLCNRVAPAVGRGTAIDEVLHERGLRAGLHLDHDARLRGDPRTRRAQHHEMNGHIDDRARANAKPQATLRECSVQRGEGILLCGLDLAPLCFRVADVDAGERVAGLGAAALTGVDIGNPETQWSEIESAQE